LCAGVAACSFDDKPGHCAFINIVGWLPSRLSRMSSWHRGVSGMSPCLLVQLIIRTSKGGKPSLAEIVVTSFAACLERKYIRLKLIL
jgi:hypothetical protein